MDSNQKNNHMKPQFKKAFSLLEISIVIVIIGVIIVGVTQSSRVFYQSRLNSARAVTKSSPTLGIPDLALWLEPTLPQSFGGASAEYLPDNNASISTWYDSNSQVAPRNDAKQLVANSQPKLTLKCYNDLPCVTFDGLATNGDYLSSPAYIGRAYPEITVFTISQKVVAISNDDYIFGNGDRAFGINSSAQYSWKAGSTIASDGSPGETEIPGVVSVYSAVYQADDSSTIYKNGVVIATGVLAASTGAETATTGIGNSSDGCCAAVYGGNIMEIIIYTRALSDEERISVEKYLSKKWKTKYGSLT